MNIDSKVRLAALRERMTANGFSLTAIGPGSHMDWLLGFHPHSDERLCLLLVGLEKDAIVMSVLNVNGSLKSTAIELHTWSDEYGPKAAILAAIHSIGACDATAVVVDETMRADFALLLLETLPRAKHSFTEATLGWLRMRKSEAELAALKMNAGIADRAMQRAFARIEPGTSETELELVIKKSFSDEDVTPALWIVASGANGALALPQTGRRLEVGDAVLLDIGGQKDGFYSDITRMAVVGHAPDGYSEVHSIIEGAVQAALQVARPGVLASRLHQAARTVIARAGYDEYFTHRTGHGIGIDLHEPPYIGGMSTTVLEAGMVFSIEPGIYLPGRFGVRLEEIVILRDDGPEILSSLPRDVYVAG
ncbi:MAG: aminopeptidase P family protein [Mesorhizobium sp.]|nr:MAG: aminopeptidase P family protein [Mesorhizobium sp.]RWI44308.1 MAG: aminopeptidase P family protein [Mesorhizobium sp.]RWJ25270.1 MAG: aminopeptidase P family protein [Mesorhizobium sp.]RWJ89687.1 MAG: aminopeptidase P family protein [Mesorhizobium sp.]RWK15056.1 MAG: aminopeptidase P family protein [Mesorhizobium sp.]